MSKEKELALIADLNAERMEHEKTRQLLTMAQAKANVLGGEWCKQNRAEGRGPCGVCAWCCAQAISRAETAEYERDALRTEHDEVVASVQSAAYYRMKDQRDEALATLVNHKTALAEARRQRDEVSAALAQLSQRAAAVTCGRQEAPSVFWRHVDALSAALSELPADLAAAVIHEAEERGARWMHAAWRSARLVEDGMRLDPAEVVHEARLR